MNVLKTKIVNYAGMKQSMGAVFSVLYGKDRVIMDFGSAFNPYISNYVKKDDNWIIDKLSLGLLPKIDGLYPRKYLKNYNLLSSEESEYNSAVFVSHLHLDHMSNIGSVDSSIPVYMSNGARIIEEALEDVGLGVDSIGRKFQIIENGKEINVGAIKVLPIINNKSSYCMYGYLIKTPDLTIGYTADFSMNYENPECVYNEMKIFKKEKVDVLYMDNCNFDDYSLKRFYNSTNPKDIPSIRRMPNGMTSFKQHYNKLSNLYKNVKGLIVFNHYEREMYDVERIIEWAKKDDRIVLFEPKNGYIVNKYFNVSVNIFLNEKIEDEWFKQISNDVKVYTREDVLKNPKKFCLNLDYKNIKELEKLSIKNSVYIHAEGNPFNPKEIEELKEYVKQVGYEYLSYDDESYYQHGYPNNVKYFVDQVDPKVVIGYHGKYPERILANNGYNLVPELYKTYYMNNGKLEMEN